MLDGVLFLVLLGFTFVCLSVPPHIENLFVWVLHFISNLVLGRRDVDWCLDLCYLFCGWGKFISEIKLNCILFQIWFWVGGMWIGVWIFVICFAGGGSLFLKLSFFWGGEGGFTWNS